jgi:DNA-binding MarR family transcriptional regulator
MATVEPLSPTEEVLWRAVMRIVKVIPRHLDSDLIRGAGLTASEYTTIMHLSEAPNRELRMADLAGATDLSASRMTRLVDDLQTRGLVTKTASSSDARGNVARLTPRGMAKLKSAWPVHLASVRRRFLDCIDAAAVEGCRESLGRGGGPPRGHVWRTRSAQLGHNLIPSRNRHPDVGGGDDAGAFTVTGADELSSVELATPSLRCARW